MKHILEWREQCKSCGGTGIYVGMAERDGFGVVCYTCKGRGYVDQKVEYEDFNGRLAETSVQRVLRVNPGIIVGGPDPDSFGGMAYSEWAAGDGTFPVGSEMREYTCPAWFYQSADYSKIPNWKECHWGTFSSCKHFADKASCWERWDKDNDLPVKEE